MRRQTAAMLEGWHEGDVVDIVGEMFRLTMSIALGALFSTGLDAVESVKLREAFEVFLRGTITQIALQRLNRLPLPANRRYQAALRAWREQVRGLIEGYRNAGGEQRDLMARLLGARSDEGEALTDQELSDQVAVLLIAGAETASAVLSWATYLLCTHPEVLDAVNAEADRVLGGEVAGWEQLPELELTARVIQETMRMYPPSWLIPRTATRETRLGGRVVPAGTTLLVSEYVLHHDPAVFPEPGRFDPDRWTAHGRSASPHARRAYMPFGAGQTKCLGEQFANAETTLALASVLARWRPELRAAPAELRPDTRVVLLPRSLPVRLASRR
jgi:cytochrome P450